MTKNVYEWFSLYFPAVLGFAGVVYAYLAFFDVIPTSTRTQLLIVVTLGSVLAVLSLHRGSEYTKNKFMVSDSFEPVPWAFALGIVMFMIAVAFESVLIALAGGVVVVGTAVVSARKHTNKNKH